MNNTVENDHGQNSNQGDDYVRLTDGYQAVQSIRKPNMKPIIVKFKDKSEYSSRKAQAQQQLPKLIQDGNQDSLDRQRKQTRSKSKQKEGERAKSSKKRKSSKTRRDQTELDALSIATRTEESAEQEGSASQSVSPMTPVSRSPKDDISSHGKRSRRIRGTAFVNASPNIILKNYKNDKKAMVSEQQPKDGANPPNNASARPKLLKINQTSNQHQI